MLGVVYRRQEALSGDTKVGPQQAKLCPPSTDFITLLHGVACHAEGGDSLQVTDVVCHRDGAHGAPYPEGIHSQLNHGREVLAGQLYMESEEPLSRGVQADQYG